MAMSSPSACRPSVQELEKVTKMIDGLESHGSQSFRVPRPWVTRFVPFMGFRSEAYEALVSLGRCFEAYLASYP